MLNYVTEVYNKNKVYEINDSGALTEKSKNDNVEYSAYQHTTTSSALVSHNSVVFKRSNKAFHIAFESSIS